MADLPFRCRVAAASYPPQSKPARLWPSTSPSRYQLHHRSFAARQSTFVELMKSVSLYTGLKRETLPIFDTEPGKMFPQDRGRATETFAKTMAETRELRGDCRTKQGH